MYAYVELYNYYMLTYVCSLCSVCNMHAYFCIYFSFSFRSTIASLRADRTLFHPYNVFLYNATDYRLRLRRVLLFSADFGLACGLHFVWWDSDSQFN